MFADREQMRRVDEIHPVLRDDGLHRLVVLVDVVPDPEVRDRLLLVCADGAVERAVGLGLVQVFRVLAARERRRRLGPELRGLLEQERPHRREPRRLHRLTGLELPLPGQDRPDLPVARRRRVEAVAGAERDDVVRRRLADRDAVSDAAGQRREVGGVLGVDSCLLIGQVVVERRAAAAATAACTEAPGTTATVKSW